MMHETELFGLFFPSMVLCAVIASLAWFVVDGAMVRLSGWTLFWHPPLARLALYFVLFALVAALYPDF